MINLNDLEAKCLDTNNPNMYRVGVHIRVIPLDVLALIRVARAAQKLDRMNDDGDWYWSKELEDALKEISNV